MLTTLYLYIFAGIGAAVLWGKWSRRALQPYLLPAITDYFDLEGRTKALLEFAIFVVIGAIVGVAVVRPTDAAQALVAGCGWTGFLTTPQEPSP